MSIPTNGAMTIQRAAIFDAIRALALTAQRLIRVAPSDSYSAAYRDGYQDALAAVALVIGAGDEFGRMIGKEIEG